MEQRITSEHNLVIIVFHEEADAVLSMAWCVNAPDGDILPDLEAFSVTGCLGYAFALLATDDGQVGGAQLLELGSYLAQAQFHSIRQVTYQLLVAACMVPVA
jgi:hypothetical protein